MFLIGFNVEINHVLRANADRINKPRFKRHVLLQSVADVLLSQMCSLQFIMLTQI